MTSFKTPLTLLTIGLLSSFVKVNAQREDKALADQEQPAPKPDQDEKPAQLTVKHNNPQTEAMSATIYFLNGDSISGQISDWSLESMTLTSPDMLEPIIFSNEHVLNIQLDEKNLTQQSEEFTDLTTLNIQHRNKQKGLHGVIKGGFSNIDNTHITLNTNYAGKVKVLKKFITKMEIDSKTSYLYMGPKGSDKWEHNNIVPSWQYLNQSLISKSTAGNIAKDIKIPETAVISFDLSWKKDERLSLYFYSSDPSQAKPDDYYKLNLEGNKRVSFHKYLAGIKRSDMMTKMPINRNLWRIRNKDLKRPNTIFNAHYDIYMNKAKGEFHIFRNGEKLDYFADSKPKPESFGSAIHLISSNNTEIRVKKLTLAKWSGHLPSEIDEKTFADLKGDGERILLKNGDILLGKMGNMKDGIMEIETLYTPIKIPIIRMRSIDLTSEKEKEQPLMYAADIKCWFKDEGWIILKPISYNGNKLTAFHQAIGENEFDLNAFKRIDLNIYEIDVESPNSPDNW